MSYIFEWMWLVGLMKQSDGPWGWVTIRHRTLSILKQNQRNVVRLFFLDWINPINYFQKVFDLTRTCKADDTKLSLVIPIIREPCGGPRHIDRVSWNKIPWRNKPHSPGVHLVEVVCASPRTPWVKLWQPHLSNLSGFSISDKWSELSDWLPLTRFLQT